MRLRGSQVCREYVNFTRLEVARKRLNPQTEVARNVEMAAYLTCCKASIRVRCRVCVGLAPTEAFAGRHLTLDAEP